MSIIPDDATTGEIVEIETLEDLAAQANAQHDGAVAAARSWAEHAYACGVVLRKAWGRVPNGWIEWCDDNLHFSHSMAGQYMRTTVYWDQVAASKAETCLEVQQVLRGLPALPHKKKGLTPKTIELEKIAQEKYATGTSVRQIAKDLNCSTAWAKMLVHPSARIGQQRRSEEYNKKARLARAALREKEAATRARKVKDGVSKAYSNVRLMLDALDDALSETSDPVTRRAIAAASAHGRKAEEAISAALRGKEPAPGSMNQRAVPNTVQRGSRHGMPGASLGLLQKTS